MGFACKAWMVLLALAGAFAVASGRDVDVQSELLNPRASTLDQPVTGTVARRSLLEKEDNGMYGDNDMNVFAGDYGGIRGQGMSGPSSDADQGMSMANTGGFILVWNTYEGDLTYYGGAGDQGMCSQTWVPSGYTTVALNAPQFGSGEMCGTCVRACYNDLGLGQGERCFDAIIDNVCPECAMGDLDLGEDGDGRWPVVWEPIVCRGVLSQDNPGPMVSAQGSNPYYGKIKIEGGPSSVNFMSCEDSQGSQYLGELTPDGFWEVNSGSGAFECGLECTIGFSCCYSIGFGTVGPELFGSNGSGC